MKCMKCGKAVSSDHPFCETCEEEMARYPVKPGTPILLPNRSDKPVSKSGGKRVRKPEEQIANLRAFIFWLLLLIVALITALAISLSILLPLLDKQEPAKTGIPPQAGVHTFIES